MGFKHVFTGIPVADRDAAVGWYERFVGRAPDLLPNADEAAWQLTDAGWLYLVTDADRAGSALHTLLIDDLDAFLADLADHGITAGPIETIGGAVRHIIITDPDGNRLNVGQVPG